MKPQLYVGNKNYSSWSLRAWLVLRWAGIEFDEVVLSLDQDGYGQATIADVLEISPSGLVPCLHVRGLAIWDSLAIAEWAAETVPAAGLWPKEISNRSLARSVTSEMHSGFGAVRRNLPMNLHRRCKEPEWQPETRAQIDRILAIWSFLREHHANDGPWLFGARTIVDAFYLPVVTRFRTYEVSVPDRLRAYTEIALADPDFCVWQAASIPNSWDQSGLSIIDGLYEETS